MKRRIKLLSLLLLCTSIFFIYKITNYNNINYTVIGDGFALGIDSYGKIDYSYSDYVRDYLKENQKLKNYSKDFVEKDMTIEMLHNSILTNKKVTYKNKNNNIKQILNETKFLTLTIGLNDLIYKMSLTSKLTIDDLDIIIEEIEISFNELINEIKKYYPHQIYVIGYYDIDKNNELLKTAIKKLNEIYKNNENVIYISTYEISENSDIFITNPRSYYPNYKGYQVISKKIIDKISKKLEIY